MLNIHEVILKVEARKYREDKSQQRSKQTLRQVKREYRLKLYLTLSILEFIV